MMRVAPLGYAYGCSHFLGAVGARWHPTTGVWGHKGKAVTCVSSRQVAFVSL